MDNTSVSLVFRIEKDLKTAFERVAKEKDLTVSQMLRAYIRAEIDGYASRNNQKDLFSPIEAPKNQPNGNPQRKGKKPKSAAKMMLEQMKKGNF